MLSGLRNIASEYSINAGSRRRIKERVSGGGGEVELRRKRASNDDFQIFLLSSEYIVHFLGFKGFVLPPQWCLCIILVHYERERERERESHTSSHDLSCLLEADMA